MAKARTAKRKRPAQVGAPDRIYSPSKSKALNIKYKIDGAGILYADQYVVQFYPDEFVISFFQSEHPLIFSDADFEERDALDARCIGRFVLNPNQMHRFYDALRQNIKKWAEIHVPKESPEGAETT